MKCRYFSLIVLTLVVAACGTVATPEAAEVAMVETEGHDSEAVPTVTLVPPTSTSVPPTVTPIPPTATYVPPTATPFVPTETPIPPTVEPTMDHSAMPTAQPEAALPGDPANGQVLFNELQPEAGFACSTCHRFDSDVKLIGPGLLNISDHTMHFQPGQKAEDYIRASITDPGAFVVPDYPDMLMPRIYTEIFTEQEINDLVSYVLTL